MDCPGMPDISYTEFGKQLAQAVGSQRIPLSVMIELTERCNLNCQHCYISRPAGDADAKRRELTAEQWYRILDEMAEEGTLWLKISGGEPLLRPDFWELYTYAKSKGFIVSVFTNATLLTPALVDLFYEWPPENVAITLYGATEETYELVTGIPGSFRRCIDGIELLREHGIKFSLRTIVMTLNLHEFWSMRAYAEQIGSTFTHDPIIRPALSDDRGRNPAVLRITPDQVVELERALPHAVKEWQRLARDHWGKPGETIYSCGAGLRSAHVSADGIMYLCAMSRSEGYDLAVGSVRAAWKELRRLRYQPFTKYYTCRDCEMSALCARCPALALLENGDAETVVEYTCQIAHLRAQNFLSL